MTYRYRLAPWVTSTIQHLLLFVIAGLCIFCKGEHADGVGDGTPTTQSPEDRWVDSMFNALTPDERLGQLFMIRAHSDKGPEHIAKVEELIKTYHVGSLCFFQGTPAKQVELINRYQALSPKVPLMVAMDAEWGLGMRMKATTISFPRQLTLGAIQNDQLIYDMGKEVARELLRVGTQVNFAPVADVNNNPNNPVINFRSFGEDRDNVARKSVMYMRGMQENGVMACAKHFPGHGDTDVDSHLDLPVITHPRARLDSIELYPFKVMFKEGIGSVMVAHLNVPALDDRPNRPTTLSQNTVTDLLKNDLQFQGLVFTDALEMKGVTKNFKAGQVEAEALLAGDDVLVLPEDIGVAIQTIKQYIKDGKFDQERVDRSVKRILRAKYRLKLTQFTPIPVENVDKDVNRPEAKALKQKLYENALTLVRNKENLLPFDNPAKLKLASLSIGATETTKFQNRLGDFAKVKHFQAASDIAPEDSKKLLQQLRSYKTVAVSLHNMNHSAGKDFGISQSARNLIRELGKTSKVVVVVFGNPYSLKFFDDNDWVLEAYEEDDLMQDAAAQALFGAIPVSGKLPVTASAKSKFSVGLATEKTYRLGYAIPENVGLSSDTLKVISWLAQEAIRTRATPSCVVLVAKEGRIVYERAFGHPTYTSTQPVRTSDVYDLASVTKIAATTLAIMKLYDDGQIDLHSTLGCYLPELVGSNKENLTLLEVMLHRSGLPSGIPFYKKTISRATRRVPAKPLEEFYHAQPDENFSIPVANKMYLRNDMTDSIWQSIIRAEMLPSKAYRYSDLGFYMLAQIVYRLSGRPLDQYVEEEFYEPLGLVTATFKPLEKLPLASIVPTEEDRYFRQQRIQGYVHDMGAAMLGGVSGHAGLFSNAHDLAVIMQMLLQNGYYGGKQFIRPETVALFTSRPDGVSRRGIGFDMCYNDPDRGRNFSRFASLDTFGHVGFTGVCTWADPQSQLVFVFLANRTYPSMGNQKLNKLGIRKRMQSVVYTAMPNGRLAKNHLPVQNHRPLASGK